MSLEWKWLQSNLQNTRNNKYRRFMVNSFTELYFQTNPINYSNGISNVNIAHNQPQSNFIIRMILLCISV